MERCLEWPLLLVSKDLASLLRWNWCFLETNTSQVMSHIRSHWFCSNIWARDMRLPGTVPSTPWQFLLIGESVIANSPGLARWNPSLSPYETPTDLGLMMSLDLLRCDVARDWLLTSAHDQRHFALINRVKPGSFGLSAGGMTTASPTTKSSPRWMSANPPNKKLNSVGIDQTDVVDGMIMIKFPKVRDDFVLNQSNRINFWIHTEEFSRCHWNILG